MIPTGAEDRPEIIHGHRSQSRKGRDEENRLLYAAGFKQIRGGLWKKDGALYTPGAALGKLRRHNKFLTEESGDG
jgi:hypothetical protein